MNPPHQLERMTIFYLLHRKALDKNRFVEEDLKKSEFDISQVISLDLLLEFVGFR